MKPELTWRVTTNDLREYHVHVFREGNDWRFIVERCVAVNMTAGARSNNLGLYPNRAIAHVAAMQALLAWDEGRTP
jgi:hypothetical protein